MTVSTELRRPDSLLHWTRRMLHVRRAHPVLGRGQFLLRDTSDDAVLAHTRHEALGPGGEPGETLLCVANLADSPRCVSVELPDLAGRRTTDVLGGAVFPDIGCDGRLTLTLGARGYYWLSVGPTLE